MSESTWQQVLQHSKETGLLASIEELLGWDERTIMPSRAGTYRAEQITFLAGLVHTRRTAPQLGDWLSQLSGSDLAAEPHSDIGANIRLLKRDFDKRSKLPQELVEASTRACVLGQQSWVQAREQDDFSGFAPQLAEIIKLRREQAEILATTDCRYDALLDDYEPQETTANVTRVLLDLRNELVPIVQQIQDSDRRPKSILTDKFPVTAQEKFGRHAAAAIGFEFDRGRLDVTHHPFCSQMGPHDCRITTRYDENFFSMAFFGILHEAGHGIYEQGLRDDQYGLPSGTYCSLGIHESQSRLWENSVGRSRAFWEHFYPQMQGEFSAVRDVPLDDFFFAINQVGPSLIRVEADEVTYNLHIIIRFELEQAIVAGELEVADLPAAWNEKYESYLGIRPPSDADGVLQDIHWSAGLFGYFPTYSLGNLYAAQFMEAAERDLGDLNQMFSRGEFAPLRDWLRDQIHARGQCYSAAELVELVTGKPLSHEPLIRYLRGKLDPLYGLA